MKAGVDMETGKGYFACCGGCKIWALEGKEAWHG